MVGVASMSTESPMMGAMMGGAVRVGRGRMIMMGMRNGSGSDAGGDHHAGMKDVLMMLSDLTRRVERLEGSDAEQYHRLMRREMTPIPECDPFRRGRCPARAGRHVDIPSMVGCADDEDSSARAVREVRTRFGVAPAVDMHIPIGMLEWAGRSILARDPAGDRPVRITVRMRGGSSTVEFSVVDEVGTDGDVRSSTESTIVDGDAVVDAILRADGDARTRFLMTTSAGGDDIRVDIISPGRHPGRIMLITTGSTGGVDAFTARVDEAIRS